MLAHSEVRVRAIVLALGALALFGCAAAGSMRKTVSGWLGSEATPHAYYAAVARAKLHREPEASSEVVGELALHEGVLSYRVEDGFAYVRAERSGRSGWVRTTELVEQLPPARKPVGQPARGVEPAKGGETVPGGAPSPAGTAPEAEAEPEDEPAPPEPSPEKSIFDPY